MRDRLLSIINHFGVDHQIRKLDEEHGEVVRAINEYETLKNDMNMGLYNMLIRNIAGEIVDNFVVLMQFANYYGIEEEFLKKLFEYKVTRTENRIKEEEKNS